MLKIGLSYINGPNKGDEIIYQTAKYLVEKSLAENNIHDYELIPIDILLFEGVYPYENRKHESARKAKIEEIDRKIKKTKSEEEITELLLEKWHQHERYQRFAFQGGTDRLKDLDLMIFGGGGLIKYHAQHFHYILNEITEECQKQNIPVLIFSAGVEGYDENDRDCHILKTALNRDCVKYISVRDDYDTLKSSYLTNPAIQSDLVCDPAFWCRERYRIEVPKVKERIIGVNGIRFAIWKDYMYAVDQEKMMTMYHDLIILLAEHGYLVELFSNGMPADNQWCELILSEFSDIQQLYREKVVTKYYPTVARKLIQRIAQYDRFMGVRLHASIVGSVLGIPNVNLVWNVKQLLFGEQTGTKENFLTKESFQATAIFERLMRAEPYQMDETYKASVYTGLNKQISQLFGAEIHAEIH